jgi:PEP-CTERM motif
MNPVEPRHQQLFSGGCMKRFALFAVVALVFGLVGATPSIAGSLIVNGNFNSFTGASAPGPDGWGLFSNGQVTGWTTTNPGGLIEIDSAGPIGPGTNPFGTYSMEVNANVPETVSQTITGLVAGQQYTLTWEYGGRPGSGGEEAMNVLLGGNLIATDSSGIVSTLTWTGNTYTFIAGPGGTETLSFVGLDESGNGSYGNEVTDISLTATPEPSTWLLLLSGFGLLGYAVRKQQRGLLLCRTV